MVTSFNPDEEFKDVAAQFALFDRNFPASIEVADALLKQTFLCGIGSGLAIAALNLRKNGASESVIQKLYPLVEEAKRMAVKIGGSL